MLLRPSGLRDASKIDTGCSLFGEDRTMPLGLGPLGFAGMFHETGKVAAARAAHQAGLPGIRERDTRNGFRPAARLSPRQMADMALRPRWLIGRGLAGVPGLGTLAGLDLPGAPKGVMAQAARFSADPDPAITRDKPGSCRTVASGAGPMCCAPWRLAPILFCLAGHGPTALPLVTRPVSRRRLT